MKRDVKVSISGIQDNENGEKVEVVSMGELYEKDNKIYVSYDDTSEGASDAGCQMVKSLLKVKGNQVEIIKKGVTETHMVFVEDKDTLSYYSTPFGELEVAIHTDRLQQSITERGFRILLEYALEINASHMSNCNVDIKVEYMKE